MAEPIDPSITAFVAQIKAGDYARFANSEDYIERVLGYKIIRKQVAAGRNSLIFKCDKIGFPDLHCIVKPYKGGKDRVRHTLKEETCQIMRFCDSKCASIINFIDICYTAERIYVMVDWSTKGDLVHHLKLRGAAGGIKVDEAQVRIWAIDLLNGVEWLQSHAICHRNIAPSVLVLTNDLHVKLSGLSDAVIYTTPDGKLIKQKWHKFNRLIHWNQPPEVAKRQEYDPRRADIWSMGATLFWMIVRSHPLDYKNKDKLTNQLERSFSYMSKLSEHAQEFVKGLLTYQPPKRLVIKSALQHPWVAADAPPPPPGEIVIPMDAPQVPGTAFGPNEVDAGPEASTSTKANTPENSTNAAHAEES